MPPVRGGSATYDFAALGVGGSCLISGDGPRTYKQVLVAIHDAGLTTCQGRIFRAVPVDAGVRVWRVS